MINMFSKPRPKIRKAPSVTYFVETTTTTTKPKTPKKVEKKMTPLAKKAQELYEASRKNISGRPSWAVLCQSDDPYDKGMYKVAFQQAQEALDAEKTYNEHVHNLCDIAENFTSRFSDSQMSDDKFQLKQSLLREIQIIRNFK